MLQAPCVRVAISPPKNALKCRCLGLVRKRSGGSLLEKETGSTKKKSRNYEPCHDFLIGLGHVDSPRVQELRFVRSLNQVCIIGARTAALFPFQKWVEV